MGGADVRRAVAVPAVALPPIALGVVTLVVLILAALGNSVLWPTTVLNPAEAAATADEAAFIRLVRAGADPNRRLLVRAGLRESVDVPMTPLEAAVDADSEAMLDTVLAHGGVVEGDTARVAVCIAARKAPHLLPVLQAHGAPAVDLDACPKGTSDKIELLRSLAR